MRLLLSLFIAGGVLFAQTGAEVSISQLPPPNNGQIVQGFSGGNPIYICYSKSTWPLGFPVAISAATNANPVVFTSTGHGFNLNSRPNVFIKGGTGSWAAVNTAAGKLAVATIIDANTFSIPVDSTAFGAVAGSLTFATTAPRLNQLQWAVKLLFYDGSGNTITPSIWLNGSSAIGSSKCSDATSVSLNAQ